MRSNFSRSTASPLRIITVGDVDHGKSTLLGRLLYDTHSLSQEQLSSLHLANQAHRGAFEFAFALDAFWEEQSRNITMDVTEVPLRRSAREYLMIDAPGHREFLKNMITGASRADAAILVVSIRDGIREQTERHLQLLKLLGIDQIIVAVNKLDLLDFSQQAFEQTAEEIKTLFNQLALPYLRIIPLAARLGANVVTKSPLLPWYEGPALFPSLSELKSPLAEEEKPLRFFIQDVYHVGGEPLLVGRVESGTLRVDEELLFWSQHQGVCSQRIRSIEEWGATHAPLSATAGESIAIRLQGPLSLQRGDLVTTPKHPPLQSHRLVVRLFWFEKKNLCLQQKVILRLATQRVGASVASILHVVEGTTSIVMKEEERAVHQDQVADVSFQLEQPLFYDFHQEIPTTGRLLITLPAGEEQTGEIIAGGGILNAPYSF